MSELKMKTVSGKVVSTTTVSLSKAAKILSNFTSSDNGASPAFAAYLRRASASFAELAQLHKKYKGSVGEHKVKTQRSESIVSEGTVHSVIGVERKERHGVNKGEGEDGRISVDEEKRRKSEKRGEDESVMRRQGEVDDENGDGNVAGAGIGKKSKKGLKNEVEAVTTNDQQTGEEKRHKSEKRSGDESVMRREGEVGEENGNGNLAGTGAGRKKSKKKGRNHEVEEVITNDQAVDHDAIKVNEVKNAERFDGSEGTKKKKREKHGREKPDETESLDVDREIRSKKKNDMHEIVRSAGATDVENEIENFDVSSERRSKKKNDNKHEKADLVDVIDAKTDLVDVIDAKTEIGSFDVSKERRSKKKHDKHEKERSDDPVDVKKEMQSHRNSDNVNGEATHIVEDDGNVQKKRKKHKKKTEERIDEQRDESKENHGGDTDHVDKGGVEKKHKKKQSHAVEEKENEGKLDSEEANNKESRKRKHESVGTEQFESSQEQHKSKKKKRLVN